MTRYTKQLAERSDFKGIPQMLRSLVAEDGRSIYCTNGLIETRAEQSLSRKRLDELDAELRSIANVYVFDHKTSDRSRTYMLAREKTHVLVEVTREPARIAIAVFDVAQQDTSEPALLPDDLLDVTASEVADAINEAAAAFELDRYTTDALLALLSDVVFLRTEYSKKSLTLDVFLRTLDMIDVSIAQHARSTSSLDAFAFFTDHVQALRATAIADDLRYTARDRAKASAETYRRLNKKMHDDDVILVTAFVAASGYVGTHVRVARDDDREPYAGERLWRVIATYVFEFDNVLN